MATQFLSNVSLYQDFRTENNGAFFSFRKFSNTQHNNAYYMYSLRGFGNTFWFISNQVDDPTFLLAGFEQNATCPDSKKKSNNVLIY